MRKIVVLFLISFTFLSPAVFALFDIDNAVEESENKKTDNTPHEKEKKGTRHSSSTYEDESLNMAVIKLICFCWFINQGDTRYDHHPYEKGNWYLENSFTRDYGIFSDDSEDMPKEGRLCRFSLNTSFLAYPKLGYGNETKLETMLCPFAGLSCTNTLIADKDELSGIININGILPVFQFNKISMYLDFGWQRWYGDAHQILRDNSFLFGLEFKSYPINPLVLEYQISWQYASNNTTLQQMGIHAGFIAFENKEFYAEYKRIAVLHDAGYDGKYTIDDWNGFALGTRIYF